MSNLKVSVKYSIDLQLKVTGFFGADLSHKLKGVRIYAMPSEGPPSFLQTSKTNNLRLCMVFNQGPCHVTAELDSEVLLPGAQAHITATIRNESR